MFYSSFTIENFRSFQQKQELKFAVPNKDKIGSGITLIVGENNSGKTTLIEGIFLYDQQKIKNSEKRNSGSPSFELYNTDGVIAKKVTLIRHNSYTLVEDPKLPEAQCFEIVPARRHWTSAVSGRTDLDTVTNSSTKLSPRLQGGGNDISAGLKYIEADTEKYNKFISFVQEILPKFSGFAIGYEDNEFIEYITQDGLKHKSDFLGDGVISILRIMAHLFTNKERPLIIDEPELSLHPSAQKKLLKIFAEQSKHRQIIISTHSPYFISWEYIKNGAVLNKITKHEDRASEIHKLQEYYVYENLVGGANWQQPFLMDVVAKEIFFHDNFLFVEGQEDAGLLKQDRLLEDTINIFGYGVRGKDAFKFALQLASDLGIRKAAVLLDGGESEKEIQKELSDMFKNYKIVQWLKEDIRDKESVEVKEKIGYFDKSGTRKPNEELDDYLEKIEEINTFFKNGV